MQVFAFGRPTVWEEKGEFRLTVLELLSTEAGGLWQLAFEKAKGALARDTCELSVGVHDDRVATEGAQLGVERLRAAVARLPGQRLEGGAPAPL